MTALVACFGCRRENGDRVAVDATDAHKRKTLDRVSDLCHDHSGIPFLKFKKVREHTFFLCQICRFLFDNDSSFQMEMAKKASSSSLEGGVTPPGTD